MMLDPTRTSRLRSATRRASNLIETVESRILFATYTVLNTNDAGAGSLREQITLANAHPNDTVDGVTEADRVIFAIPGAGVKTINLASPLPTITDAIDIDGTGADFVTPTIELNGAGAGAAANGLTLASSDAFFASFVAGLIINRFSGNGIVITGDSNGLGLNYIGTNAAGTAAGAGNGGHGILIQSSGNFISENTIGFNGGDGIAIVGNVSGNDVALNHFNTNGGLAIDLGDNGRTANDAGDADVGPNELQNFPIITGVTAAAGGGVDVQGTVNSKPNTDVDIALYYSTTADGEGQVQAVHFPVRTDASGNATFNTATVANMTLVGATTANFFTATATELLILSNEEVFAINTSEMSDAFPSGGAEISEVYVRGSTWLGNDNLPNVTFKEFMQSSGVGHVEYGYLLPAAPTNADTVSWINADEIVIRYSGPVSGAGIPVAGTIQVDGARQDYTVTQVNPIDDRTFALRLDRPLGNIPGGGIDGDRIRLRVPGAGPAGATFTRQINVLQGDASRDVLGRVNAADQGYVKSRVNRTTNAPGTGAQALYTVFADVNGDARVNAVDQGAVKSRINDGMPAAAPAGDLFSASRIADEVLA